MDLLQKKLQFPYPLVYSQSFKDILVIYPNY